MAFEVENPTLGDYVRVNAVSILAGTLAKIDCVSLNVAYEDPTGSIIRIRGQAKAKGRTYFYTGSGIAHLNSSSVFKLGFNYVSQGLSSSAGSAINMGGHSTITFEEVGNGGLNIDGQSDVVPYIEITSGGLFASGEVIVIPYIEIASGGITASGQVSIFAGIKYIATGGPVLQSAVFAYIVSNNYKAEGGVKLVSHSIFKTSSWVFVSDGSPLLVGGSAGQVAGNLGTYVQTMKFGMVVLETTATFSGDVELNDGLILTSNIAKCGCDNIALTMQLTHNLALDNNLAKFLVRNNLSIKSQINLNYNASNDSWQSNLHYRGLSAESSSPESWDLTFELQCTDTLGSINIGTTIWRVAIEIYRKNLVTRSTYSSRIIVAVLPDTICGTIGNSLDFNITYNTQLDQATIYPNAVVYYNSIFDNIGLFKNQAWVLSPDLLLNISQINSGRVVQRVEYGICFVYFDCCDNSHNLKYFVYCCYCCLCFKTDKVHKRRADK